MANNILFSAMSSAEREAWLKEYRKWLSADFPEVENTKISTAKVKTVFEQGLALLAAFPFCRSFVKESLAVKDYHRRMKVLRRYADKVTSEVQKDLNTAVDLNDPSLLVPRVGRPSKEMVAARALDNAKKLEKEETLFGKASDLMPTTDNNLAPINPAKAPSLAELRWLMSPSLQEQVDRVRDLRSRAEEASTRAKQMAEDGRAAEEIAPFAQTASDCFEAVNDIYAKVDYEMAVVYVRLKEDTAYIDAISKISKCDNGELRTWLRPYWDKQEDKDAFKAKVIEFIKQNDPEQAAIRKANEEKKAQIDAILKYLQRKDKPNTKKRLVGMRKKLDELHELMGEEANDYEPLLVAAQEDYEKNILPAEEKKRAERETKRNSKKEEV